MPVKKTLLLVLVAIRAFGQGAFVRATSIDSTSTASLTSPTGTTTTGNVLFVWFGSQLPCTGWDGPDGLTGVPTDTGGDTFVPIFPTGASGVLLTGIKLLTAGSAYAMPVCTISGGGGTATCTAIQTGGVITALALGTTTVAFTGAATVAITDTGPGTGATAMISGYGIGDGGTECSMTWYAKNVTGTTNNQVTAATGSTNNYVGLIVLEASGVDTAAPFEASVGASTSGTSVTTGNFASGATGEIALCGARVEALTQTWTAGTSYTIAGTTSLTFTSGQYRANFNPSGTSASISSGTGTSRTLICAAFKSGSGGPVNSNTPSQGGVF